MAFPHGLCDDRRQHTSVILYVAPIEPLPLQLVLALGIKLS